ncbi:hypothetical protein HanIR_Chr07g0311901 [Helianthus annuus]|nr:hypothetical protein HanIR_Chr07g0311901 [Helianthus annuus]
MRWFTLIKYFLTTVLMKISAAKLDNTRYHRNWLTAARSCVCIRDRGCDT